MSAGVLDQNRLTELKTALDKCRETMDRAVETSAMEEKGMVVSSDRADGFRNALTESREIIAEIKGLEGYAEVAEFMDTPPSGASSVAQRMMGSFSREEMKSLGEMFVGSDEFKEFAASGSLTMKSSWTTEVKDLGAAGMERKDVYTVSGPAQSTRGLGTTQFDPIVPREYRRARVRDLFPVSPTNSNLIDFFRVIGFGANRLDLTTAAATVAERIGDNTAFAPKPHSNLTFEADQAPVRTIAHWEAAHRNVIRDEPQLRATIDNELLYGIRLEEDDQILNGSGTGEDLRGILVTPGIQAYTQQGGQTKADAIRRAATRAMLAYYEPTGIVLHPYDWEDIELLKDSQGRYIVATNVAIGGVQRLWRQPVVDTPAMPQGSFLTGAFGLGAQLYDREEASIRVAEQHADFFIRNAIVILAEERLALAVKRPEAFVRGTFL